MDAGRVLRVFALPTKKSRYEIIAELFLHKSIIPLKTGCALWSGQCHYHRERQGLHLGFCQKKIREKQARLPPKTVTYPQFTSKQKPPKSYKTRTPKRKLDSSSSKHPFFRVNTLLNFGGCDTSTGGGLWSLPLLMMITKTASHQLESLAQVYLPPPKNWPKKLSQDV